MRMKRISLMICDLSLNPCSNGMPLNDAMKAELTRYNQRLNPCSNGMPLN